MLIQYPDHILEKKLDIIRQQKQMALDQNKKESYELLSIKEDLIVHVRLLKYEQEMEKTSKNKKENHQKKTLKKQSKQTPKNTTEQTESSSTESNPPDEKGNENSNNKNNNNHSIQLTLDL